jgi:hypothetical protein
MIRRRQFLLSAITCALGSRFDAPVRAQGSRTITFNYHGFVVDATTAQSAPNLQAVIDSLKHQIDIIADCGATPKIIDFFKSQPIVLKAGSKDGGGHFNDNVKGITLDVAVVPPEKPVALHEMLHAFHYWVLPERARNPDVLRFFQRAKEGGFYPPNAYVLTSQGEFFAVTGSLYLWGNVDRPPHDRKTLHDKQPVYYKWLGDLFGVVKDPSAANAEDPRLHVVG